MKKQRPVCLTIDIITSKETKSFHLGFVLLSSVLYYAATISRKKKFSIKIYENGNEIEDAIITTNNIEEIKNLKIFLRNLSKEKDIVLKSKMDFLFSLI